MTKLYNAPPDRELRRKRRMGTMGLMRKRRDPTGTPLQENEELYTMGRKPKATENENAGTVETPAVELAPRQIARQKTARFAALIETVTDDLGYVAMRREIGGEVDFLHVHLSDFSETLLPAVQKIKKQKAAEQGQKREQLVLLLSDDDGKKIAAELLAAQSPIDPRE